VASSPTNAPTRGLGGDFWKFWVGQAISNLGSSFTLFALPLLVYQLTGSALNLGLMTAVEFLPYVLFGLVLGAWADRVDRKHMMILTDVARAAIIASIPLLAGLDLLVVWWIYAVGFISSTLKICFDAGEFAAVPSLVGKDDLIKANGRIQASYSAAFFLGPLLAGALLVLMPVQTILLFDALSFLASALALALVTGSFNVEGADKKTLATLREDVVEGLRYVLSHPVLRNISIMMALINFLAATTHSQLVLFAKERLGASDSQVGLLYSAGALGVAVLSLAADPVRKRLSFSKAALGALMLYGLLIFGLAFVTFYWIAVPVWALALGFGIFFNINTSSLRQSIVPNRMLGRVQSIAAVLAWSAIPLGAFLGGLAIEETQNVALVYGMIGVLVFVVAFAFSFTALGRAERYLEQEKTPGESEQTSTPS
jgi:MFS family permease